MANEVSICNQAIGWLGGNRITSFDDGTAEAALCKDNYAYLRNAVLEEGKWAFATARFTMSTPSATAPEYGFTYKFLIPNGILLIMDVRDDSKPDGANDLDWRREGDYILCDSKSIFIKAIIEVTDPNKFTATFIQALACRLAAEFAVPLTESQNKANTFEAKYASRLSLALAVDGMQGSRERLRGRSLLRNR